MPNSDTLKDAAHRMILATRQFIEAIEAEEAATGAASAVPAHMVNMPPETRAVRADVATLAPDQINPDAPASKTSAADAIKAESDASNKPEPSARRTTGG